MDRQALTGNSKNLLVKMWRAGAQPRSNGP
jgi:hypothetical protein